MAGMCRMENLQKWTVLGGVEKKTNRAKLLAWIMSIARFWQYIIQYHTTYHYWPTVFCRKPKFRLNAAIFHSLVYLATRIYAWQTPSIASDFRRCFLYLKLIIFSSYVQLPDLTVIVVIRQGSMDLTLMIRWRFHSVSFDAKTLSQHFSQLFVLHIKPTV